MFLKLFKKKVDKNESQASYGYRIYDALLFLPPVTVKLDKKTKVIEKNGVHVAIMYSETSGVEVAMDLPADFLKQYYKMTTQINQGNPSNRIVYFAMVYISPQEFARKRAKVVREVFLKANANAKRKFFLFPRWIWLTLERYNNANNSETNYFVINKFEDNDPTNYLKEFDTFGAVGVTFNNYFVFTSVTRKDYLASINKRISLGLWGF
ncbi:hypothetical protein AVU39_gp30 [Sulfolobus monocaudavirus SMV2]|jgi:hypothetical protein|uniref:hypothetical protein n=1 Tax=Sulfolobus monocaudavirus SMV2 TaxID=1580591 RepID=UPI0006D2D468|nr:hypothetical protein AVU39_gp30 [Sulfolobus monocaudavirus SMV2]AIZ11364.1 hypothetical protein [Sulfolobus monocaudavirus SMV2]